MATVKVQKVKANTAGEDILDIISLVCYWYGWQWDYTSSLNIRTLQRLISIARSQKAQEQLVALNIAVAAKSKQGYNQLRSQLQGDIDGS